MLKVRYLAAIGAALALLAGCGGGSRALKNGELNQTITTQENAGAYIEVMGIGAADPAMRTQTQRRASSRNAAIVDAEFQLVKKLRGVQVEGGITVERAMETDSRITTKVNDMVKGMEVVKIEWTNDDGCVVTVRLSKRTVERELGLKLQ